MKMKIAMIAAALLILVLGGTIIYQADVIGVSSKKLEQSARKKLGIDDSWKSKNCLGENAAVMLFYNAAKDAYTYAVYRTKEGPAQGFFYTESDTNPYMEEGVAAIIYDDEDLVLMSLNKERVSKIMFDCGNGFDRKVEVEPSEPFAYVIDFDYQQMVLYDEQENAVTVYDTFK